MKKYKKNLYFSYRVLPKSSPLLATVMNTREQCKARLHEIIKPIGLSLKELEELKLRPLATRIACLSENEQLIVLDERKKIRNRAARKKSIVNKNEVIVLKPVNVMIGQQDRLLADMAFKDELLNRR